MNSAWKEAKQIQWQEWQKVSEGVRFKLITFEGVPKEEADGAVVEIEPGHWTPIECLLSESVFVETPQKGRITIVVCDNENNIFVDTFDTSVEGEGAYNIEVHKGDIMVSFAHKENSEPAEQVEFCEPGFYSPKTDLKYIKRGDLKLEGRNLPIPKDLWEKMDKVEQGVRIDGQTFPGDRS